MKIVDANDILRERGADGLRQVIDSTPATPIPVQRGGSPLPAPAPPKIVCASSLAGRAVPQRKWIVPEWTPSGVVTGLYGDGGLGKSLLAQQLQTAAALGRKWLTLDVEQCTSLGVFCEDSDEELHRRQADINFEYGVDYSDLDTVHLMPRLGEDNLLMTFGRNGVGELTKFHNHVLTAALDLKTRLVIVDPASDTFGGNENDRNQVRQFVSRALGSVALAIGGAVLLCLHPSRTGLSTGEGDGGSTSWSNSLRSRLYLRAPDTEAGEPPDANSRILQRRKANYAARSDELRLRWRNGVIVPEAAETPGATPFGKVDARDVFLDLLAELDGQNRPVSDNRRAGNYAPKLFNEQPRERRHDYRQIDFIKAMESLFAQRRIEVLEYGFKSHPHRKLVATSRSLPGSSRSEPDSD